MIAALFLSCKPGYLRLVLRRSHAAIDSSVVECFLKKAVGKNAELFP